MLLSQYPSVLSSLYVYPLYAEMTRKSTTGWLSKALFTKENKKPKTTG